MKFSKILSALILTTAFSVVGHAAETKNVSFKVTMDGGNVSVSEEALTGNIDNSELDVVVYRCTKEQKTVVYTGKLGGFDGGAWNSTDFSKIQYSLLLDWENKDQYYCIVPMQYMSQNVSAQSAQNALSSSAFIMYDNKYYEKVLVPGTELSVPLTIKNSGGADKEVFAYIAQYNADGGLVSLKRGENITVPANTTVSSSLSDVILAEQAASAKVLLWENGTLRPVNSGISLGTGSADYYANDFTAAQELLAGKQICGVIDTDEDIDIVRLTPSVSGIYAIRTQSDGNVLTGLYNSSGEIIASTAQNNEYILYLLTGGEMYYLRMSGSAGKEYTITPGNKQNVVELLLNTGSQASFSEADDCSVFLFSPSEDGEYLITAVNTQSVDAKLYNKKLSLLQVSETGDENVSFRLSHNMQAGNDYYILVSGRLNSPDDDFTMYVERPLSIVLIE